MTKQRDEAEHIVTGITGTPIEGGVNSVMRYASRAYKEGVLAMSAGMVTRQNAHDVLSRNPYGPLQPEEWEENDYEAPEPEPTAMKAPTSETEPLVVYVRCRQCGKDYHSPACGPSHALVDQQITLTRCGIKFEVRHSAVSGYFVVFDGIGVSKYFKDRDVAASFGRDLWTERLGREVDRIRERIAEDEKMREMGL